MTEIDRLVRENVKRLKPYSCARDDYKGSTGIFLDANENPFGDLNRYPDPYQGELKTAISRLKGIDEKYIFLGNGSDEIIDLCFRVFCNPGKDKAMILTPTYGMYEVSASINDVEVIRIPLNKDFQINKEKIIPYFNSNSLKMIFICSPNNPTGNNFRTEDIEFIIQNYKGMVIIDEAYSDFSEKPSFLPLIKKYKNLLVMQTFSKALGLASVRIGMAFSDPSVLQYFNRIKPPYNISTVNQKAALGKLASGETWKKEVMDILRERERLKNELSGISGVIKIYPSDANFLLVKVVNAELMYNYLVDNHIIVRNRSSVLENCIRITVGTPEENDKLLNALKNMAL